MIYLFFNAYLCITFKYRIYLLTKNKIYATFFSIIVFAVVASPVFIAYKLLVHKNKVVQNIENNKEVITLNISKEEYNKCKVEENELNIYGKMFDVQSKIEEGDNIKVTGFFDIKEDVLKDTLKHSLKNDTQKKEYSVFAFFFFEEAQVFNCKQLQINNQNHTCKYNSKVCNSLLSNDSPPPNFM